MLRPRRLRWPLITVAEYNSVAVSGISKRGNRPRADEWPHLWLNSIYLKQREGRRIVSLAATIAMVGILGAIYRHGTEAARYAAACRSTLTNRSMSASSL